MKTCKKNINRRILSYKTKYAFNMKAFENNYTTFPIMLLRHFLDFLLKMNIKIYKKYLSAEERKSEIYKKNG